MNTYTTMQVARIIGVHPNTVRLYEKWGLIPKANRRENGYRVFTDFHVEQLRLSRLAFKVEVLQNGLRKSMVELVKVSATGDFTKAISLADAYVQQLDKEQKNAEEAIYLTRQILEGDEKKQEVCMKRREVSAYLEISMDTLRNWELNGLLSVKRKQNGYRFYTEEDLKRLKIIRSLRCANYSLEAILRMLNALSVNPKLDIKEMLDTPRQNEEIIAVCDKLISSLQEARENAVTIIERLKKMQAQFS